MLKSNVTEILFAIAIQPLSIALRSSQLFQGVVRGGREYRVSLYADDLLLFLSNPTTAAPHVLNILAKFGKFSLNRQNNHFTSPNLDLNTLAYKSPTNSLLFSQQIINHCWIK